MKKVLVTGDRGYIGSVLVPMLLSKGYEVVGIDTDFFEERIDSFETDSYRKINKDIRDIKKEDVQGVDTIIHLAALSNDPSGDLDPVLTKEINYYATVNLAKLAKGSGVKKFIFSSSCSVYGKVDGVVSEKSRVSPITAYAKTKVLCEEYLKKFADKNFCVVILRNSTVYGYSPNFRDDLVVNNFLANGLITGKIIIKSDGTPWRPLIDVRDLSRAFIEFLEKEESLINGGIFNVGFNENNFQIKDILTAVKKELPDCIVEFSGEHGKDSRSYKVNFDKFKRLFPSFKREWDLGRSVKDMILNLRGKYTDSDFLKGKYTRIEVLKKLKKEKKFDEKMFRL